jgi:hypothetical protein
MSFYSGLQKTATRLISGKGQTLTISRKTGGTYSPALGKIVGQTITTAKVQGVVFGLKAAESKVRALGADDVPTDVQYDDKKILISGSAPMDPKIGDSVDIGGVPHSILSVTKTSPGGIDVLTTITARAGA